MLINMSEHFKTPKNFQAPQRGIVVFNDDPRRLGRVKCVIAGLIEGKLADLPWVSPWYGGESTSSASGHVPEIGAILTIEFKFEDIYTGFYTGAWKSSETASGLYNEDYPNVKGSRDEYGNTTTVNKVSGVTEFTHSSGSTIEFDSAGNLGIKVKGKINLKSVMGKASAVFNMDTGEITLDAEQNKITGRSYSIMSKITNIISATFNEIISGAKTSQIAGGSSESVGGSKSTSVAGASSTVVAGSTDDLFGQKHSTTYGLGKQETIVAGGDIEKILLGDRKLTVVLGDVTYSLLAGNYKANLVAGNIELQTLVGIFKCGNALGNLAVDVSGGVTLKAASLMTIQSVGPMSIKSSATIDMVAPMITLNKALGGMVLTTATEQVTDFISGKPTIGVPTVLIG